MIGTSVMKELNFQIEFVMFKLNLLWKLSKKKEMKISRCLIPIFIYFY